MPHVGPHLTFSSRLHLLCLVAPQCRSVLLLCVWLVRLRWCSCFFIMLGTSHGSVRTEEGAGASKGKEKNEWAARHRTSSSGSESTQDEGSPGDQKRHWERKGTREHWYAQRTPNKEGSHPCPMKPASGHDVDFFFLCYETQATWLLADKRALPALVRLRLEKVRKACLPHKVRKNEGFFSFSTCSIRSRSLSKNRESGSCLVSSRNCSRVRHQIRSWLEVSVDQEAPQTPTGIPCSRYCSFPQHSHHFLD